MKNILMNFFSIITFDQAKKSRGIRYILQREGLFESETAAFGDGHNDLSMLEMVGLSIAMENAVPEVKSVAHYVTKSNDENGVAWGIKQYL